VVDLLDHFLLTALRRVRIAQTATDGLLRTLHRDRGATPIMRWMRAAKVDSRRLERQFRATTGVTPKQYARVIRFKSAYHSLIDERSSHRPLSARLDGFYDQSHFNREFRFFTGLAPSARLRGSGANAMNITDHLLRGDAQLQPAATLNSSTG
jgi:methylphosphotriester-DNA--protein-cysteine methyltransferase